LKSKPSQEQIKEWLESPVNEYLTGLISTHIENFNDGVDSYHPFEPQKTQEILAGLNGALGAWEDILDVLEGDWTAVEEDEDE